MKKMINILIVLILLSSLIPLAFADASVSYSNNVLIDAETEQQIEIMRNGLGAEIRLLQLEKAITKNIHIGEEILSVLKESDMNITELQLILYEFEFLRQDVQSADPNASDAVIIFLDLKHDAINFSKDFRDTLRGLLNITTLEQIQQRIRNMTCNKTQNLSQIIQNKIRKYNIDQFRNIYQFLGENGSTYLYGYQNGSMTQNQVKQNITMRINQTGKDKQFNLLTILKQQKIRYRIQSQNQIQNASEGFQQRLLNRFKMRLQRMENPSDNPLYQQLKMRLQYKFNNMGDTGGEVNSGNGSSNGGNNGDENGDSGSGREKAGFETNGGSNCPGGVS
jgi:hypothetical protein